MKWKHNLAALAALCIVLSGCSETVTETTAPTAATEATTATLATTAATEPTAAQQTQVQFTNSGITATDSTGLEIDGTALSITDSGTYVLSGSCQDGSVKVKKGVTGVHLVLDGLTLSSQTTAPLVCAKSSEVTIEATGENTLSDTQTNNEDTGNTDAENAVIKCKDGSQVTLCGDGTLRIQANGKNGIKSGASTAEEGEASLTIRDLTLEIDAPVNDAVNAEASLQVLSGTLTISAADDALHCDNTLSIGAEGTDGPTIAITSCYEGLEGATVNVYSGDISILSTDDCINAANSDLSGFDFQLNIFGGNITAYASEGDGFDSNGDLTISGGTVVVWTANTADNEPLDADGTVTISGGTVLACGGSSGMGMNLIATQPCIVFGEGQMGGFGAASSLVSKGAEFSIASSDGTALYSAEAVCNASFAVFSSDKLTAEETYVFSTGDAQTEGTAQSGSISSGNMGGPGGQRPDGNGFGGQPPEGFGERPDGDTPPEKPGNAA